MAILPLRTLGDPVLRERSFRVAKIDESVRKLVVNLTDTLRELEGVGLAAPQIGVLKRVFVIDVGEGATVFINPEVLSKEDPVVEEEGCLSVPPVRVNVTRYGRVRVRTETLDRGVAEVDAEGLLAKAIQHEMDHIDGTLVIDRLDEVERRKAMAEIRDASGYGSNSE